MIRKFPRVTSPEILRSLPIQTLPEKDAPPKVTKLPPDARLDPDDVLLIKMGAVLCRREFSNEISEMETIGLVPSPISSLLAVKTDLPVPP